MHSFKTVTYKQVSCVFPSNCGTFLQPTLLFNTVFRSPQFKKKSIETPVNLSSTLSKDGLNRPPLKREEPIARATSIEIDTFFETLVESDEIPAILWILPVYAQKFRPKPLDNAWKFLKNSYLMFKYAF